MEYSALAGGFVPPAPYSLEGYFDTVTRNIATRQYFQALPIAFRIPEYDILRNINARPTVERAALLGVYINRLIDYGYAKKFFDEPAVNQGTLTAEYIMRDFLNITPEDFDTATYERFRRLIHKHAKELVNARGKSALKQTKWVYDMMNAKTAQDVYRVFLASGHEELAALARKHEPKLIRQILKKMGARRPVRNRVVKVIAVRVAWCKGFGTALGAVIGKVMWGLEMLIPEDSVGEFAEEQIFFFGIATKAAEDARLLNTTIIERFDAKDWKYRIEPIVMLQAELR